MSNYAVGDRIITPGGKLGEICSVHPKISITWDNGLSAEYTPKQLQAWNYKKSSEEKGAIAECNLDTPVSLQESPALNSELKQPEQLTSSLQNYSSKTTPTLKQSLNADIPTSRSTVTSGTITLKRDNSTSTQLDFLVLEHPKQETEQDLNTQNHHSGLSLCAALPTAAPVSSSLKILKGLSLEDYEQFLGDSEWSAIVGTIRSSYRRRKSDHRKAVTDSSLLPTPTTYAKGSTGCRPAGQTRLEQKLKPYLTKGDKLNPAVPGWMMGFPVGWVEKVLMDGGEAISIQLPFTQEYVTTSANAESVTTSTPVQSAHSRQQLQLNESVTSPISSQLEKSNIKVDLYICDRSSNVGIVKSCCSTYFVVDWKTEKDKWYFWERDELYIAELAITSLSSANAPQSLVTKFLEENHPQLCTKCLKVVDRNYTCDRCKPIKCTQQKQDVHCPSCESPLITLNEGCGVCGWTPVRVASRREIFLEEKQQPSQLPQQPKPSKQKGCLYKYLENKKLKDGTIASYPRVIGDRKPDNPNHWRWGFNWEEKIDGEWKGRSIGSIPVGAIPMIQSMQNDGASLKEIIDFIKRAKSKKS